MHGERQRHHTWRLGPAAPDGAQAVLVASAAQLRLPGAAEGQRPALPACGAPACGPVVSVGRHLRRLRNCAAAVQGRSGPCWKATQSAVTELSAPASEHTLGRRLVIEYFAGLRGQHQACLCSASTPRFRRASCPQGSGHQVVYKGKRKREEVLRAASR